MTDRARALVDPELGALDVLEDIVGERLALTYEVPPAEGPLIEALEGVTAVFVTSRIPITDRVLRESELDVVAKVGTGIDSVDLRTAADVGVPVTYTPGLNAMSVAEHALGLLLAVSKRIPATQDTLRAGGWRDEVAPGRQLHGGTIGVVGFGDVGRRIASLVSGLAGDVLAHDPYVDAIEGEPVAANLVDFETLVRESDAIFASADLTAETRGLFDAATFASMNETAYLVNTARGPIVDEDALIEAVTGGEIAGAALDVYEDEPLATDSPLHDLDEVVTTPHIASRTVEATEKTVSALAENALALLDGESIPTRYDAIARERARRNERRRRE